MTSATKTGQRVKAVDFRLANGSTVDLTKVVRIQPMPVGGYVVLPHVEIWAKPRRNAAPVRYRCLCDDPVSYAAELEDRVEQAKAKPTTPRVAP